MRTDQAGMIVGNARSKIYHTPDQQGYHMNSANAVYFNSEAEAQTAGSVSYTHLTLPTT